MTDEAKCPYCKEESLTLLGTDGKDYKWYCTNCHKIHMKEIRRLNLKAGSQSGGGGKKFWL